VPGCHSVMQDALDIGLCSSRWLCARIFFRRSSRGRKFIKPRCSSSGRIALPLKQSVHMASPSITAVAGTSMPARRRCAAQKYFSITHLLRGAGRERIGSYQKTIIRSGPTFAGVAFDCACHQDKRAFASLVPAIIPSCQKSTTDRRFENCWTGWCSMVSGGSRKQSRHPRNHGPQPQTRYAVPGTCEAGTRAKRLLAPSPERLKEMPTRSKRIH